MCHLGNVQCTEALSAVDGPGLRYVVYFGRANSIPKLVGQGSAPFSSAKTIIQDMQRMLVFLTPNNGGLTCSGLEPLKQASFCEDLFVGAHDLGVTNCLHTTPPTDSLSAYEHVLDHTDYVTIHLNTVPNSEKQLGRYDDAQSHHLADFASLLEEKDIPYHVRYLLVPEITDHPTDVRALVDFAQSTGSNMQGVQIMPYHLLGGWKWEALGLSRALRSFKPFKLEDAFSLVQMMNEEGVRATLAV